MAFLVAAPVQYRRGLSRGICGARTARSGRRTTMACEMMRAVYQDEHGCDKLGEVRKPVMARC